MHFNMPVLNALNDRLLLTRSKKALMDLLIQVEDTNIHYIFFPFVLRVSFKGIAESEGKVKLM